MTLRPARTPDPDLHAAPDAAPALLRALEGAPAVNIPADFAHRVAALAASRPLPQPTRWRSLGIRATLVCTAALTVALFVLAPHTTPGFRDLRFDLECVLLAELACSAYILTALDLRG